MAIRLASAIISLLSIFGCIQISAAFAETYQRMLLVPGNVTIASGGGGEIPSRCLDKFSDAPTQGLGYQAALVGSSNTQVRIGNRASVPIQEAINRKLIAIEGNGFGFTKLRVRNLTNERMQIITSGLTILSPDNSYPSEDLAGILPDLAKAATEHNSKIWQLRESQAAKSYSKEQLGKLKQASLSPANAAFYDALVKRNLENRSTAAILLIRTDTPVGPVHTLFSGNGQFVVSNPFDPIGELYSSALTQWNAVHPNVPLTVALAVQLDADVDDDDLPATAQRFDATYLLLAAAATGSGGGGSGGIIVTHPASFPEPPDGWKAFAVRNETGKNLIGPPTQPPPVPPGGGGVPLFATMEKGEKGGPYEYTEKFRRGEAHAFARQLPIITSMGASIHQVFTSDEAETLSKEELLAFLERSVRSDLDKLYKIRPVLQQVEKGGPPGAFLEASVDGAAGKFQMANIQTPFGEIRVTLSNEIAPQ
jgi:hypothetical protein